MLGEHNYQLLRKLKAVWDPNNIFNPGKITDTPSITENLRFSSEKPSPDIKTIFDFSNTKGIVRAAEKCSGSGDCRKSEKIGGTMCPSFMASHDEKNSTRARANILQEFLTNSKKSNPFNHKEIYEIMDLCLSCKACKSECPSSVDMAKLKAEFLQHYYDANGIPLRAKAIAHISNLNAVLSILPQFSNFFLKNRISSYIFQSILGFSTKRKMPLLQKSTLNKWFKKSIGCKSSDFSNGKVYLFNDEFTNYNDTDVGINAIRLLTILGYEVKIPKHEVSARTFLSKGLLRKAKTIANKNVSWLKDFVSENSPLIGIEPSAILSFRDEYPELVDSSLVDDAKKLAANSYLIDEFLSKEIEAGKIAKNMFTKEKKKVLLHGHCQQKAIASTIPTKAILSFPENYEVEEIPSGCCGMAGSFGYEKEHYDFSMKVGELVLFPNIRKSDENVVIAADGTSCRHQIKDGTQRQAFHAVEILYDALII
jgi:Fe-S oxidoreductase